MYFTPFILLAGLSLTNAYDDGMYHPDQTTTFAATISHATSTSVISQATTSAAAGSQAITYVSSVSGGAESTWYPTLSKSTYVGYWSHNATTTTTPPPPKTSATSNNSTVTSTISYNNTTMKPGNVSMTMTSERVYTTTVCDFQSSCYTTLATSTGGFGQVRTTSEVQPTMTPFSSSSRLIASGWGALALCGIALLL